MGGTAGIGEPASADTSGEHGEETGVAVVSDAGGAETECAADATATVACSTGDAEEGCGRPAKTCVLQGVPADGGAVPVGLVVVGDAHAAAARSTIGATMSPNGYLTHLGRAARTRGFVDA
jgi:hypothetical protein